MVQSNCFVSGIFLTSQFNGRVLGISLTFHHMVQSNGCVLGNLRSGLYIYIYKLVGGAFSLVEPYIDIDISAQKGEGSCLY